MVDGARGSVLIDGGDGLWLGFFELLHRMPFRGVVTSKVLPCLATSTVRLLLVCWIRTIFNV